MSLLSYSNIKLARILSEREHTIAKLKILSVLHLESMELTYAGAGFQETALVQMGNGEQLTLNSEGLFISTLYPAEMMIFKENSIYLTPATTILFNTDGLTEQGNGKAYYRNRLPNIFYGSAHLLPHLIVEAIVDDFRLFNNGSLQGKDDITFLVLRVEGK